MDLWVNSWIAALVVGIITWGLIIWCLVAYRRRKGTVGFPRQLSYNMPLEIFYLIIPLFLVLVFFSFTARDQQAIDDRSQPPTSSSTSAASSGHGTSTTRRATSSRGRPRCRRPGAPDGQRPIDKEELPTLYLPVNKTVEIELDSRDVIHSFWVLDFLYKKDMIPGKTNYMSVHPHQRAPTTASAPSSAASTTPSCSSASRSSPRPSTRRTWTQLRQDGNTGLLGAEYDRNPNLERNASKEERRGHVRPHIRTRRDPRRLAVVPRSKGRIVVKWITSTDHKTIGYMYLIASFMFFCLGGVMALLIRAELFEPGMQILQTKEQYNQLFTMHGTIMLLMFATPLFAGFANVIMPLQIGAPDVAFPRLNALAFWFFLFGSTIAVSGFITPQGAASFGWFAYAPLSNTTFTPRHRR